MRLGVVKLEWLTSIIATIIYILQTIIAFVKSLQSEVSVDPLWQVCSHTSHEQYTYVDSGGIMTKDRH
jgi:hypothetical protein